MLASTNVVFFRFSPENMSESILRQLLTGKEKFLEQQILEMTSSVANKTPRYILIVGPRGIGKSHIIMLLYYEIKKRLSNQLIPIKFAEEEYSIFRASDIFLRALEEKRFDTTQIRSLKDENLILDAAVEQLKIFARHENKQYVFLIENLHMVFCQLEKVELQKLRSIFQKNRIFSILATAPLTFEGISEHDEPFYNFFKITHLDELTLEETKELMKKIAAIEQNKSFIEEFATFEKKVEGIYHLTGGSPRLVVLLYEIITRGDFENLEKVFLKMMDEHTPYYQEIFQMLPPQRRLILDTLMTSSTPLTPKDIANNSRVDEKTVNQQLRRLENDGYLLSHRMKKRTSYEVRERLFRLWRDMRKPLGKNRISIFIDFLTCWYTPEEREGKFKTNFDLLSAGDNTLIKEVFYFAESLPPECRVRHLHEYAKKLTELGATCEVYTTIKHLKCCVNQIQDENLKSSIFTEDGKLRFNKKEYEKALISFDEALKLNPKDLESLCQKSIVLHILNRFNEALNTINIVLKIRPNNVFALILKASILGSLNKYEESLEVLNKSLSIDSKNPDAYYLKGLALRCLNQSEESLKSLDLSLEIEPRYNAPLELKGHVLIDLQKFDDAVVIFDKLLEQQPENVDLLYNKCTALLLSEKYECALESINRALMIKPNDNNLLSRRIVILLYLNQYEKAIIVADEILASHPNDLEALNQKAMALNCLGKFDQALVVFNKSLKIKSNDPFIIYSKVFALCQLKQYNEASEIVEAALNNFPGDLNLLQVKTKVDIATEQYENAIETANKLIKLEPNNAYTLQNMGLAFSMLERPKEALEVINQSLEIDPNNSTSWFIKSVVLSALDRYNDALEWIEKVIKIEPNLIFTLRKVQYLLILKRFSQVIDVVKNVQNHEDYLVFSNGFSLALIEAYIALGNSSLSQIEIEKLKTTITNSNADGIMKFADLAFMQSVVELKAGNYKNGKTLIKMVYQIEEQCPDKVLDIKSLTINFLKTLIELGNVQTIESATDQIISCKKESYRWFVKPLTDALEIIKTGDTRIYYREMQSEEREVVAEIVKKITKSDKLSPSKSAI
jgi:uncharacterized protein